MFQSQFSFEPSFQAKRIVSLVPSQTEMLHYFGLDERIVGITNFCIHPATWSSNKSIVGGTKKLDIPTIISLQPDLIIANKEENIKEHIETLAKDAPVYVSEINNLNQAFEMMLQVGLLVNARMQSEALVYQLLQAFDVLANEVTDKEKTVAYLLWRKPYMVAGGDTFIHDMLTRCGLQNIFGHQNRYPTVSIQDLQNTTPAILLLSSEPYPFSEKHITELQHHLPDTKILLVDGEMFSWYGSRLLHAIEYFKELIAQF